MKILAKMQLGSVLVAAILAFGAQRASAVELMQSEGTGQPNACVAVANGIASNGQHIVAVSCGYGFASRWQFHLNVVEGLGSASGVVYCLQVRPATKLVILHTCSPASPLLAQEWSFRDGQLISAQFGGSFCLDASAGYGVTLERPAPQLRIAMCNGSPTQEWQLN